jgi:hypothetical protein
VVGGPVFMNANVVTGRDFQIGSPGGATVTVTQ